MLGHPLHPALVHFPLALLLSATIGDVAWLVGLTADTHVAAILMAAGLAGGLLAMAAGLIDFSRMDEHLMPHAARHMMVVAVAWLGYAAALYLRRDSLRADADLDLMSVGISIGSGLLLALGGWLGGRLVYKFGVGVARVEP